MSAIEKLQEWYLAQCNEDWEHTYGINIGTLDNPGWYLKIDLSDTHLSGVAFAERSYGIENEAEHNGNEWLTCKVTESQFVAYGGPQKLEEMITIFIEWGNSHS